MSSIFLLLLGAVSMIAGVSFPQAHALAQGIVCISGPSSTSCPASPITFTGASGTMLDVAVNIQGSESLNGFDIFIKADPTVLSAVSVNLTSSVLGPNVLTIANCIGFTGSGCTAAENGVGIVRVAMVALAFATTTPTTGHLFSVEYNIIKTVSNLKVGYQNGCRGTSALPDFCVTVVQGGTLLPETVQESTGVWGDFAMTISSSAVTVLRDSLALVQVTLKSMDSFFGSISISSTISPMRKSSPIAIFMSSTNIFLPPGTSTTLLVEIATTQTTTFGTYTFTITGTAGALSHSTELTIKVPHR
jgi:hypothetical protein